MFTTMRLAEPLTNRLRNRLMPDAFLSSRAHEVIPAGMGAAVRKDARLLETYRRLHDLVAKPAPPVETVRDMLSQIVGASRGESGTLPIPAPEWGVMFSTGVVGAGVPFATGVAPAQTDAKPLLAGPSSGRARCRCSMPPTRQQGSDRVAAVCSRDGGPESGSFPEGRTSPPCGSRPSSLSLRAASPRRRRR